MTEATQDRGNTPQRPLKVAVIVGSLGYRRLLTTLIRGALPGVDIEEVDPFSQTMRGPGIAFAGACDAIVVGGIGTMAEARAMLSRLTAREDCPPIVLLVSPELEPRDAELRGDGAAAVLLKDALSGKSLAQVLTTLATGGPDAPLRLAEQRRAYGEFPFNIDNERVVLGIEGYRPITTLSANPMAQVVAAESLAGRQRVVIKVPVSTAYHDPGVVARFCDRYAYFSSLGGVSVVRYLDAGIAGSWPYVVLEHLSAGDLRQRMAGGLTTGAAVAIMRQLAAALVDVHAGGFAHMDLKPENIFFREDGRLVLIDFNISTRMGGVAKSRTGGEVLGSPFYMSPEQGQGLPVDGRSDLYSAGIIFYEMLTGERPFAGENSAQVIFKHIHEEVPLLPRRIRELQPVIDLLLAKHPGDRFADAGQFLAALPTAA